MIYVNCASRRLLLSEDKGQYNHGGDRNDSVSLLAASLQWYFQTSYVFFVQCYLNRTSCFIFHVPLLCRLDCVCSCHVKYAFQSESTFYSCLNVKELLAQSRCKIWSLSGRNLTRTHNHLVLKRKLNHLAKRLAKWAFLGLFTDGEWRAKRPPSLKSVTHILQWWNLAELYLSQRQSKKYINHMTHPWVLLTSAFFHQKSANFVISRNTDTDYILIHNFYLF